MGMARSFRGKDAQGVSRTLHPDTANRRIRKFRPAQGPRGDAGTVYQGISPGCPSILPGYWDVLLDGDVLLGY